MYKGKKKLMSALIIGTMTVSLFPVTAFADEVTQLPAEPPVVEENGEATTVNVDTIDELKAAITNAGTTATTIVLTADMTGDVTIPEGANLTITSDATGTKTLNGKITCDAITEADPSPTTTLKLENLVLDGNGIEKGFGITSQNQTADGQMALNLSLVGCTVKNYSAKAMYLTNAQTLLVDRCVFENNATPTGLDLLQGRGDLAIDLNLCAIQNAEVMVKDSKFIGKNGFSSAIKVAARGGKDDAGDVNTAPLATIKNVEISNCEFAANTNPLYDAIKLGTKSYDFTGAFPFQLIGNKSLDNEGQASEVGVKLDYLPSNANKDLIVPAGGSAVKEEGATEVKSSVAKIGDTWYNSLQEALAAVQSGETITLAVDVSIPAGAENNIELDKAITIDGAGHTITRAFIGGDTQDYESVFSVAADGVTIQNVKFAGLTGGSKEDAAIYLKANNMTVKGCTFTGSEDSGVAGIISESGYGDSVIVSGNEFTNLKYGMYFNAISNAEISGNQIAGTQYTGIFLDNANTVTVENNTLTNIGTVNYEDPAFASGIYVNDTDKDENVIERGNSVDLAEGNTNGETIVIPEDSSSGGGGIVGPSYDITVDDSANGTIDLDHAFAVAGVTVKITAAPADGYVVDTVTVTDADGKDVDVKKLSDNTYSFKMPKSNVTVSATFKADGEPEPALPFTDVAEDAWYYPAVSYVYDHGMMNGMTETTFEPQITLSRAMMAATLYKLEGQPDAADGSFADVDADAWYADAVNWAAANGIVSGYGNDTFGPQDPVTREQMAAILYRYAEFKGMDVSAQGDLSQFTDADLVHDWAKDVMSWAVGAEIINGMGDGTVNPQGTATRAEVATILMNFCEKVMAE